MESAELIDYYRRRAGEYGAIYAKPERQADLAALRRRVGDLMEGCRVLEIACGKDLPGNKVRFLIADAYALDPGLGRFDAAFAGFWWSHVPRAGMREFLGSLHARLEPGARVVLLDNRYVEGSSTPILGLDAAGNTYQRRRLGDGSELRVLKNFPSEEQLRADLAPAAVRYQALQYYWLAEYRLP